MIIHSNFDPSSYARQVFRIVLLAILVVMPMRAQTVGGAMLGTISDQSGAPMDGVEVSIKNVATGLVTVVRTNAAGFYTAPTLTPGEYEVTASMQGFSTQVRSGMTLTVNGSEVVN